MSSKGTTMKLLGVKILRHIDLQGHVQAQTGAQTRFATVFG